MTTDTLPDAPAPVPPEPCVIDPLTYRDHIHDWFGLTYASYLVLPRLILQEMPPEFQIRFIGMLKELDARFGHAFSPHNYKVYLKDDAGRFVSDPLSNYRRGTVPEKPEPQSFNPAESP